MIDREHLVAHLRANLFDGKAKPKYEAGVEAICLAFDTLAPSADYRHITYVLATAWHEARFQVLREVGKGKGRRYGAADPATGHVYYGRGFVQLTWKHNYDKMGRKLGHDLVHNPDIALQPAVAAGVLVSGMLDGDFTGKALSHYIAGPMCDYVTARRIVNGNDRAALIAGYARKIEPGVKLLASSPAVVAVAPTVTAPDVPAPKPVDAPAPVKQPQNITVGFWQRVKNWFA
jgi:glycosyl hydrolase family 19 (putative chitinase)